MSLDDVAWDVLERTPIGRVIVAVSPRGVCFVGMGRAASPAEVRRRFPGARVRRDRARAAAAREELREYFAGTRRAFTVRVDWQVVPSTFHRRVLQACARIPAGATRTYGELARAVDAPGAARAVGAAMASNPVPIIVPCHRVRAATGLGGFTGGLERKRTLLRLEGALLV